MLHRYSSSGLQLALCETTDSSQHYTMYDERWPSSRSPCMPVPYQVKLCSFSHVHYECVAQDILSVKATMQHQSCNDTAMPVLTNIDCPNTSNTKIRNERNHHPICNTYRCIEWQVKDHKWHIVVKAEC